MLYFVKSPVIIRVALEIDITLFYEHYFVNKKSDALLIFFTNIIFKKQITPIFAPQN